MPHPTTPAVVRHPEADMVMVALDPAVDYDPDDILVRTYPWAFAPRDISAAVVESVSVEAVRPLVVGRKRTRSRRS